MSVLSIMRLSLFRYASSKVRLNGTVLCGTRCFGRTGIYFTSVPARPCLEEETLICAPRLHRYPARSIFRSIDKFLQTRTISLFKKQGNAEENCVLLCCKVVNQIGNLDRKDDTFMV